MICNCQINSSGNQLIVNRTDPTRTATLRNRFSKDYTRRYKLISRLVKKSIVTNNCFGLAASRTRINVELSEAQFAGMSENQQTNAFIVWLAAQIDLILMEEGKSEWANKYIKAAYKQGIIRARQEIRKAGGTPAAIHPDTELLDIPFHAAQVEELIVKKNEDTDNINEYTTAIKAIAIGTALVNKLTKEEVSVVANKVLTDRLPRKLTVPVKKAIKEIPYKMAPMRRAEILARTTVVKAHHVASINEYRSAGVTVVDVIVEFTTAGDEFVCQECRSLAGNKYTLKEIYDIIPVHPRCRCFARPIEF